VRVDHVSQLEAALPKEGLVLLGLDRRVDDGRLMRLPRRDEIRRTAAAFVEDLFEVHDQGSGRNDTVVKVAAAILTSSPRAVSFEQTFAEVRHL
jgi:hypothetical protein